MFSDLIEYRTADIKHPFFFIEFPNKLIYWVWHRGVTKQVVLFDSFVINIFDQINFGLTWIFIKPMKQHANNIYQ